MAQIGDSEMAHGLHVVDVTVGGVGHVIGNHGLAGEKGACDIGDIFAAVAVFGPTWLLGR